MNFLCKKGISLVLAFAMILLYMPIYKSESYIVSANEKLESKTTTPSATGINPKAESNPTSAGTKVDPKDESKTSPASTKVDPKDESKTSPASTKVDPKDESATKPSRDRHHSSDSNSSSSSKKDDKEKEDTIQNTNYIIAFVMDKSQANALLLNFVDIVSNHWAKDNILIAIQLGLFKGVSDNEFAPEESTTRAMVFALINRMSSDKLSDANGENWYMPTLNWAVSKGISDGTNPDKFVSREELATMLYRFANKPQIKGDLTNLVDRNKISDWSKPAMEWAVAKGYIKGYEDNTVRPQDNITRAELSTVLIRFLKK